MSTEEEREIAELQRTIQQLEELKERLRTDVCVNVMLEVLSSIVDDVCLDVCIQVHRCHRLDLFALLESAPTEAANRIVDAPGYDVHGQIPEKVPKNESFNCDHCGQKVGAAKFAAHLAKCMGHGGRQQRLRGGTDSQASAPPPLLSNSPSNTRPVPSPPPPAPAGHLPHLVGTSTSPLKRAPSPSKIGGGDVHMHDSKRPRSHFAEGEDAL